MVLFRWPPEYREFLYDIELHLLVDELMLHSFSLFLYGRKYGDSQLLRVAHAFEQLSAARKKARPYKLPESDLKDFMSDKAAQRSRRGTL